MNARPLIVGLGMVLGIALAVGQAIAMGLSIYVIVGILGLWFALVVAVLR